MKRRKRKPAGVPGLTAEEWNAEHPIGTAVIYKNAIGDRTETFTRGWAWTLGHGDVVVCIEGKSGCVALWTLEVAKPAQARGTESGADPIHSVGNGVERNHGIGAVPERGPTLATLLLNPPTYRDYSNGDWFCCGYCHEPIERIDKGHGHHVDCDWLAIRRAVAELGA